MICDKTRCTDPVDGRIDDPIALAELKDKIASVLDKLGISFLESIIDISGKQWFENRRELRKPDINFIEI